MKYRLLLFTRYPIPGKSKTRLVPALSPQEAAQLQREMTKITLEMVLQVQRQMPIDIDIEIRYTGGSLAQMERWLGRSGQWRYVLQGEGDLGARLTEAFADAFAAGKWAAIAIGSDCPQLSEMELRQALEALAQEEVVLGPAIDGGYYLIGMRHFYPQLFQGIAWSTSQVLEQTIRIGLEQQLSIAKLPPLADIDRPEDLPYWLQKKLGKSGPIKLSIIIPTRNESQTIGKALTQLLTICSSLQDPIEIIIVDGNSSDDTVEIARSLGVIVLETVAGRGHQMNVGASQATGDILLFLHADTQLPPDFYLKTIVALSKPKVIAGAFLLEIAAPDWQLRIVEWGANLRSRQGQLPYGDQGIFLLKTTFREIGGFPEIPIMEDFVFVRQLQKRGKIDVVPSAILTSPRRWQRLGVWKTTIVNQGMVIGYFLGIPLDRLAQWYRHMR